MYRGIFLATLLCVAACSVWTLRASAVIQVTLGDVRLAEEISVGEGIELEYVSGVVASSGGRIFVSDLGAGRIVVFDHAGDYVTEFRVPGAKTGGSYRVPSALAVDSSDRIVVASLGGTVTWFDTTGASLGEFSQAFEGLARGLAVGKSGDIIISHLDSAGRAVVSKYDPGRNLAWFRTFESGKPEGLRWSGPIYSGADIDVDVAGEIFVSRLLPCTIEVLTRDGKTRSVVPFCDSKQAATSEGDWTRAALFMNCVTSTVLALSDGRLLVSVVVPYVIDGEHNVADERFPETLLELVGTDLRLVDQVREDYCLSMEFQDSSGRVYAACNDKTPIVRRFRLTAGE